MSDMLYKAMVEGTGQADLRAYVRRKFEQWVAARDHARQLEVEYRQLIEAAITSGYHPWAELLKKMEEATREALTRPPFAGVMKVESLTPAEFEEE